MEWHLNNDQCLKPASAEREGERLHSGVEELDLELAIHYWRPLANQLIQTLLRDRAVPLLVYIAAMTYAGRLSIDEHS